MSYMEVEDVAPMTELPTPTGWQCGELLKFLELQRGVDLPVQDRVLGEIPIFGSNGLLGFHNTCVADGPGVITGRSGTIGRLFYTESKYWPLNTSLYVKNFKGNLPKFVYYKLDEVGLAKFSTGTGVPTLNRNVAHKEVVVFPPLPEQRKIASILTAVDDKLDVITRQIDATETLKRGLMQALFSLGVGTQDSDGRWVPHTEFKESELGKIPAGWAVRTLESISAFITKGGTPTTYGFDWDTSESGIPFFRSECVTDKGFNQKGMNFIQAEAHQQMIRSQVEPGDVLMTITGNIGRVARAPADYQVANINQHIARVRIVGNCDPEYVFQCLRQGFYAKHYGAILTGQAYPQISLKQVRETLIPCPSINEQRYIATALADCDLKITNLSQKHSGYQNIKRGLIQKLLSGEWRVKLEDTEPVAA
ncbi:restriction endonuclease subunit S [Paraburkholderia terrae]